MWFINLYARTDQSYYTFANRLFYITRKRSQFRKRLGHSTQGKVGSHYMYIQPNLTTIWKVRGHHQTSLKASTSTDNKCFQFHATGSWWYPNKEKKQNQNPLWASKRENSHLQVKTLNRKVCNQPAPQGLYSWRLELLQHPFFLIQQLLSWINLQIFKKDSLLTSSKTLL